MYNLYPPFPLLHMMFVFPFTGIVYIFVSFNIYCVSGDMFPLYEYCQWGLGCYPVHLPLYHCYLGVSLLTLIPLLPWCFIASTDIYHFTVSTHHKRLGAWVLIGFLEIQLVPTSQYPPLKEKWVVVSLNTKNSRYPHAKIHQVSHNLLPFD